MDLFPAFLHVSYYEISSTANIHFVIFISRILSCRGMGTLLASIISFYLSIRGIGNPIWIWTFTCFQLKGNEKSLKEEPLGAIWILQEANIEDNGEMTWTLDLCIRWMDGQSCQDNLPGNCLISGVASCLISSALAMGQVPQQLLQI